MATNFTVLLVEGRLELEPVDGSLATVVGVVSGIETVDVGSATIVEVGSVDMVVDVGGSGTTYVRVTIEQPSPSPDLSTGPGPLGSGEAVDVERRAARKRRGNVWLRIENILRYMYMY